MKYSDAESLPLADSEQRIEEPKNKNQTSKRSNVAVELLRKKENKNAKISNDSGVVERNDRYLFILLALISMLLIGVYYYYKKVINRSIPIIETAMAQDTLKKKDFLN